jgi:hypothetical protein
MPEKPGAAKGQPDKEAYRKGITTPDTPDTAYEFTTELTTPGTKTTGPARGTAGAIRDKGPKKPIAEE